MLNGQFVNYKVEAWDTLQRLFKVKSINDHTLHFVATLAERLDLERFKQAVNLSADAFPLIRSSFNETQNKSYWEDKEKSNIACIKSVNLMEKLFDIFPYKLAKDIIKKRFSNPLIAFTNIGIIDKTRLTFGKIGVVEAYMTGSIKYSPYFQLAISTFNDQATLSINLYGTQSDRNTISFFLDKLAQELNDIM